MKVCLVAVFLAVLSVACGEIGSDLGSTLKIVGRLCYIPGDHSDPIATQFFACYDRILPADKAKFTDCQIEQFGSVLNTKASIDKSCINPFKLPSYASCLKTKFGGDEQAMNAAILIVNQCQGKLLGLE